MRSAALWWGVITMDQALRMPGGLDVLFQHGTHGDFGGMWVAYLPNAIDRIYRAGTGSKTSMSPLTDDLAAFGRYLLAHPDPPWINGPVDDLRHYILETEGNKLDDSLAGLSFNEFTYLGAAATLLIISESIKAPKMPTPDRWRAGPLADLYPYLEQRHKRGSRAARLADLPVPDPFKLTFRNWAAGEANLIGQGQPGTG